ncbi:DUF983 domain-containing protein [Roseococcus sp. SDR]|uniref:DUF983 domain-containing protein n=1 Tax=Roseococcus sp. SDR TaxID=2835532 RepID=UPI001BCC3847|nr:DUF983 domain-containing protein [Roseococcus sp. SDR]MBS7790145.1 DUF983 domain-containing protein [Roseococcus sp. SDR]MBV1845459.1 DUF983 domain-containing protein [Roseococcus sp. SDR]
MPEAAPPTLWQPDRPAPEAAAALPPLRVSLWRGARNRCPVCGEGHVFQGYLRVAKECEVCHAPLGKLRADDAPPYFTIFLVGHLLIPPVLWIEKAYAPEMWIQMAVWIPTFAIATTLLLRPVKGATVGLMSRFGFGNDTTG